MSMRKSTRRELRKLRELVTFVLAEKCCFFCKRPLIDVDDGYQGNGDGPQFLEKVTIHHLDGDHGNNKRRNHRLAHTCCHKSYHARQNKIWKRRVA